MKAKAFAILSVTLTALHAFSQLPKPGFGDKGCLDKPLFAEDQSVSANDFIEVQHMQSYSRSPVYTARLYGDGRLVWHGQAAVRSIGDALVSVDGAQAKALIVNARSLGFGGLCNEYVMRAFDGGVSITTLAIGSQVKVVTNTGPSNAPSWLYKLSDQIEALEPVQKLIGTKQDQPKSHK